MIYAKSTQGIRPFVKISHYPHRHGSTLEYQYAATVEAREFHRHIAVQAINSMRWIWTTFTHRLTPIYAGAYVYGRRSVEKVLDDGKIRKRQQSIQSHAKAKVFIRDHHEGYITGEAYEKNQAMIKNNGTNFQ